MHALLHIKLYMGMLISMTVCNCVMFDEQGDLLALIGTRMRMNGNANI